jgi:hypothetical protein
VLIVLAVIVAALAAAVAAFMLRGPSYPAVSTEPDVNATEPYHKEMRCIDRVVQNRALKAEEVQPALDRCRAAGWGGNQSSEQ